MLDLSYRTQAEDNPPEIMYEAGAAAYVPGSMVTMKLNVPTIVVSKQLKARSFKTAALSVSTNYFDPDDTAAVVDGEAEDKFVRRDNLITQKIYGCRVVITNVSSQKYNVEVLAQIPTGSVPVRSGFRTKNQIVTLQPYQTTKVEYFFYFPIPGDFVQYPAHVNKNGVVLGFGRDPVEIKVVDPNEIVDTSSWDYFANRAPNADVLGYLKSSPELAKKDLSKIAWRMQDERFFLDATRVLRERQMFNEKIWSWSLKHFNPAELEEYLNMNSAFKAMVSPSFLNGSLGCYDPVESRDFQYVEFWTAVNSTVGTMKERACAGGVENEAFQEQYRAFLMRALFRSYNRSSMPIDDRLAGCYYFLVQDRVQEAVELFKAIPAQAGRAVSPFSYDYMMAYLAFFMLEDVDSLTKANELATKYKAQRLTPSQAKLWDDIARHIEELKDKNNEGGDFVFETQEEIDRRAEKKMSFTCSHDGVNVSFKNVPKITVKFYLIDLELQFSTAPFLKKDNAYSFVQPTAVAVIDNVDVEGSVTVPLPEKCANQNTIVEVSGSGMLESKTLYDNDLTVQVSKAGLGQIRVVKKSGEVIPRAYVKVYAQTPNAPDGMFYKDGFTDMRGRFDYQTVATDAGSGVQRFAILVQTEGSGADVIEV